MATDPAELYPVIAQIAAAFAGFGSLASSLGPSKGGDDAKLDAFRLFSMLQVSISATMLGLIPATLIGIGLEQRWALAAPSAAILIVILYRTPISITRSNKLRQVPGYSPRSARLNNAFLLLCFIAFGLCALGIPRDRIAGLYLLGLTAVLGMTVVMFTRVITSMLRRHYKL